MKIAFMYVRKKDNKINKQLKESFDKAKCINTNFLAIKEYRTLLSISYAAVLTSLPSTAYASGTSAGGMSLILLLQKASFWIGIGVVVWGIIEAQLDLPGWKGRIMKGILGYIAILVVPLLFLELRDNLQVDVWNQIKENGGL